MFLHSIHVVGSDNEAIFLYKVHFLHIVNYRSANDETSKSVHLNLISVSLGGGGGGGRKRLLNPRATFTALRVPSLTRKNFSDTTAAVERLHKLTEIFCSTLFPPLPISIHYRRISPSRWVRGEKLSMSFESESEWEQRQVSKSSKLRKKTKQHIM